MEGGLFLDVLARVLSIAVLAWLMQVIAAMEGGRFVPVVARGLSVVVLAEAVFVLDAVLRS